LLGRHRLLLLEEPLEYLDESTVEVLMKWLKKLKNTTILVASNDEKLTPECDAVLTL
jgi:ATP-binding cassette subfamily B protein